jgi:hypothetical protein
MPAFAQQLAGGIVQRRAIRSVRFGLAERGRYPLKQTHARSLFRRSSGDFRRKRGFRPINPIRAT